MPSIATRYFGELLVESDAVFEFSAGIPGFEEHHRFVFIEQPHAHPLAFMQSLDDPTVCFLAIPVFVADPAYQLALSPEDRSTLAIPDNTPLKIGSNIVCLVLVSAGDGAEATVNLASPIVLNLEGKKGVQAVRSDAVYSIRHPLPAQSEAVSCS